MSGSYNSFYYVIGDNWKNMPMSIVLSKKKLDNNTGAVVHFQIADIQILYNEHSIFHDSSKPEII